MVKTVFDKQTTSDYFKEVNDVCATLTPSCNITAGSVTTSMFSVSGFVSVLSEWKSFLIFLLKNWIFNHQIGARTWKFPDASTFTTTVFSLQNP